MRKLSTELFRTLLLAFILVGFGILNSHSQEYKAGVLQGKIRIKVKPIIASAMKIGKSSSKGIVTTGIQSLDNLNSTYSVTEMKRVFPYSPKFEEKHKKYGLDLWYDVTIISKASSTEAVKNYSQLPEIDKAEPILEKILIDGSTKPIYLSKSDQGSKSEYFNDPYLIKQWHYNNTGQTGGTPGSDINAYKAWDITKGSKDVIVSIHDQGVDVDHEDLKDAMWVNEAELNGKAGVDDDGNGYKDDIYGFNFANNMGAIDAMPHGSHVAGTIGAVNNNGIGVSGIAGGSGKGDGVRIMSCQIMGGVGFSNTPDSYVYAADNGSIISQNSWGYSYPGSYEQSVLDAIDYFIAEAGSFKNSPMKGGIVIFAAGNSANDGDWYPGYYQSVISVAALNAKSQVTVYSNYGTWVDLAAPGGQVEDNIEGNEFKNGILSTLDNDAYGFMDGTSMACPHVSGVAALVVSKFGGSTFTNTELRSRLISGTRFIDTLAYNESYAGKLGSGSIDALMALAINGKIAPVKIKDLQLKGIAQDFAKVRWSVPSDSDDKKPVGFEVYYSTQNITESTIQSAKMLKLDSRLEPGELDSIEINYLKPLTKYYFTVVAVDRWGNKSELSNIITGTTNAGPDAQIDPNTSSLDITIDIAASSTGSNSFLLQNKGEGLLKWEATTHHKTANPSALKNVRYPALQSAHQNNGKKVNSSFAGQVGHPKVTSIENQIDESLTYLDGWDLWVLGETDTTYSNSSATRFSVSNEKGFNLTNIDAFLVHKEQTGPIILEIYEGENINDAKILYKQEVTYTPDYGYTSITLDEKLFFEKGKTFWIVFHVPSLNKYPLGAGIEADKNDSKNCYYSSDLGKTWAMFEDVYYDNQLVWAVNAISRFENMGDYISLSPIDGSVESNDSTSISASVDGSQMINGTYNASIVIYTNETEEPMLRLPVNLKIEGHKPVIGTERRVGVGGVLVGNEKEFEVNIKNLGLGSFQFQSLGFDSNWNSIYFDISNPHFSYVSGLNSWFEAKTEQTIKFKFKPTQPGNVSSIVNIQDNKGNTYSFELFGLGIDPPVMAISPSDTTITGKTIGDEIQGGFYLKNTGKFPLDYFSPLFADGTNMTDLPKEIHKFGYKQGLNPGGVNPSPAYQWTEISSTGTDVANQVSSDQNRFFQVDLGFEFPFFGKNETSVYISRYSTLSFDTEGYIWSSGPHYKWEGMPDRFISVMGVITNTENGGHVYYQRFPDKFIVQWENVPWYSGSLAYATYQAVLNDNGNINIYVKNITIPSNGWSDINSVAQSIYIGIEDQTKKDGILINDYSKQNVDVLADGSVIEFVSPGQGLFSTLTNPFGTVQPSDSVKLNYTIKTENLYVANYVEKLALITNDPINNPGLYTTNFEISNGGVPTVNLSNIELKFGQVFQDDDIKTAVFIGNTGKASTTILSTTFKNGFFTVDGNTPIVLKPGRALFFNIKPISSTLGVFKDTLIFATDEGKTYKIALESEIIDAPKINTNITDITETLTAGSSKTVSLVINNSGNHELDFAPVGNQWMSIAEKATKQVPTIPGFTYQYKYSKDAGGPEYKWVEINNTENFVTLGNIWAGEKPWSKKIDLPFTFNFYGIDYNYLYIGYNGIISFTPDQEINPFGGEPLPNVDSPNNFIAPLYGFNGPVFGDTEYPNTGHYLKIEEDRVIVEFCDFNTGFGMTGPMSYQVILYKNGNIKFQYKMHYSSDSDAITGFATIGIENQDGTDAVQIAYHNHLERSETAYELFPVKKYVIPVGGSKAFDVTLNAKELFAGSYTDNLSLMNNAPQSQGLIVPVSLTVTGSPELVAPAKIELGDMLVVETPGTWGSTFKAYEKTFDIENSGSAKAEITQIDISKLLSAKVYAYVLGEDWFGNKVYQWEDVTYLPVTDWMTGNTIPLFFQPKSVMKYKVSVTPEVDGIIKDTLTIVTDNGNITVPINGSVFMPPVVVANTDTLKVYAQVSSFNATKILELDNFAGGYELQYSLGIDFQRTANSSSVVNSYIPSSNSVNSTLLAEKVLKTSKKYSSSKQTFNRELAYESSTAAENSLGYGGSSSFYALTAFKAPADGFNLSHVQTWYISGTWLKSKIKVQVYAGNDDIYKAKLIHSQIYDYNISSPIQGGEMLTIKLDKNLVFYPNETFFVVFGFESGATYPQGVVTMPQIVKNRYLYNNGSGVWNDIADGGDLASFGWIARALEEKYESAIWVSLNSVSPDTIAVGSKGEVKIDFKAGYAKRGENTAKLVISSNDPHRSKKYVTLILDLNQGPKFEIEKTALTVNENEVLKFQVVAKDIEGDKFTMSVLSRQDFVKGVYANDTLNITCSPNYSDAGVYTIMVEAADEFGNKNLSSILLTVQDVNRAPVVINPIGNKGIGSTQMPSFLLSSIISDPDGDKLRYTVTSSNESVVKLFMADDEVLFTTKAAGTTTITITGTDTGGLFVSHSFDLTVFQTDVEENLIDNIILYPNPTSGSFYLILPQRIENGATIRITNLLGSILVEKKVDNSSNQIKLDVSGFTNGIYFVKVIGSGFEKTIKIVKN